MAQPAGPETIRVRRRRRARAGISARTWALGALAAALAVATVLGIVFSGSAGRLPDGVRIAGVEVGGLAPKEARRRLERRFRAIQRTPVEFKAGDKTFRIMPVALGIQPDYAAAVEAARREGDGFAPVRGYKRLRLSFVDQNLQPRVGVWQDALQLELKRLAARIDRAPREAAVVRHGLSFTAARGQTGRALDRKAAAQVIVRALASFDRAPVGLPVRTQAPHVGVAALQPALRQARRAVSAPVRLASGPTRWLLPRWRIAQLLEPPAGGRTTLRIGGAAADDWFRRLGQQVDRPAVDARFAVDGPNVRVVPSRAGLGLDVPATAAAILRAATRPGGRTAQLVTEAAQPARTTAQARAMGIVGVVGSYETFYGGVPNRLHNVQLVAQLIDDTLIRPGGEFSFNKTTGARTADKGFLEAPVIVNGEVQTGLGGGVCQVSTTVFNAAFEAGLSITERTNHALFISHYPLGRDATVDYPNVDLKFVNDTGHWLLLRTFVGTGSLVVDLYGTPTHRKVVVDGAPLRVTGPPPVEKVDDPTLPKGEKQVVDPGVPSQATSVRRRVYARDGRLMYDTTWYSNYDAEPKIVHVGTKKKPKPERPAAPTTSTATTSAAPPAQSPPGTTTAGG